MSIENEQAEAWKEIYRFVVDRYPEIYYHLCWDCGMSPKDAVKSVFEVIENGFSLTD